MDGGTVYNINIEGAIRQCRELVDDDSKITVDVYICGDDAAPTTESKTGNAWENYFRGRSVASYYGSTDSIAQSMAAHPDVNLRYVMKQTEGHASGTSEINFEGDFTWPMQEQGLSLIHI